ncbi:MAG: ribonuclease III [Pseudomonadota bacterium]
MIDLHIHSTASDGSCTPSEVIQLAVDLGIQAIAITDHDTTDGVRLVLEAGIPQGLELVTGVEISAEPPPGFSGSGSLHILGYGISIYDRHLNSALEELRMARITRTPRIIEKLNGLGIPLTLDQVEAIGGPGQTGRPHIAQAMLEKGYITSFDQAFDQYLGKGKPAYVDKFRIPCQDVIRLIQDAGGVAVLAHPGLLEPGGDPRRVSALIQDLAAMGLRGLEVYYTDHTTEQTTFYANLAFQKDLLVTGGSDFHGNFKKGTSMGTGTGFLNVDYQYCRNLATAIEQFRTDNPRLDILENNMGHTFADKTLLLNALRHSSYVNELQDRTVTDNQRFEFLGDAVLGLAIGQTLMERYPRLNEGNLSKFRASLVSEGGLTAMARSIDLGRFILLGKGERLSRGSEKNSILSDAFEALIAATYLDQGFEKTYTLIQDLFDTHLSATAPNGDVEDYKSILQEYVQELGNCTPCYAITGESGPDHDKTFEISVDVCSIQTIGQGKSKKAAEQNAAQKALKLLKEKIL